MRGAGAGKVPGRKNEIWMDIRESPGEASATAEASPGDVCVVGERWEVAVWSDNSLTEA